MVPEIEPVRHDPVARELSRLGLRLALPSDDLRIDGTPAELAAGDRLSLKQSRGRAAREALATVIQRPGYARLDDDGKLAVLQSALRAARARATNRARVTVRSGRSLAPVQ